MDAMGETASDAIRELHRRMLRYEVELRRRSHELRLVREDYERLVDAVEAAIPRIDAIAAANASIRSSKFWALRNGYMRIKRLVRPETAPDLTANDLAVDLKGLGKLIDQYDRWLARNAPRDVDLALMRESAAVLTPRPVISVIVPVYDPPETFLREMIESVLAQVYPFWQLCLCDDASPSPVARAVIKEYAARDERITYTFRETNGHISHASNDALALATGEFVALLDHDDVLAPHALYRVAVALGRSPTASFVYSDEDKIDVEGRRFDGFFKPDWSPDTLLSKMYTGHLAVFRTSVVRELGGFRPGFEGGQDYDLVLRVTETIPADAIVHIPDILYHWRVSAASTSYDPAAKEYAFKAAERAIAAALARRGEGGRVYSETPPGSYSVRYPVAGAGRVSVIMPTRDHGGDVDRCLSSLFLKTTYPDFEIVLLDNGTKDEDSHDVFRRWRRREPERFRVVRHDAPFNYSEINNIAVRHATGRLLLFLNNDTEIISPDWMTALAEQAVRPSVGAAGAKLLYDDGTIQHAGVVLGIGGLAGHLFKRFSGTDPGYFNALKNVTNYSAVTAACLMMRRDVFDEIGGFDEEFAVAYNDVDLCMRVRRAGYAIVYVPHAKLYHHESKSRGLDITERALERDDSERTLFQQRWSVAGLHDPYYNPHFSRIFENGSLGP